MAKDPLVLGLGYAAVRDVVAHLRHDTGAGNPLCQAGRTLRSFYAWGRSRSAEACANTSIAASTPMRRGGGCSTA